MTSLSRALLAMPPPVLAEESSVYVTFEGNETEVACNIPPRDFKRLDIMSADISNAEEILDRSRSGLPVTVGFGSSSGDQTMLDAAGEKLLTLPPTINRITSAVASGSSVLLGFENTVPFPAAAVIAAWQNMQLVFSSAHVTVAMRDLRVENTEVPTQVLISEGGDAGAYMTLETFLIGAFQSGTYSGFWWSPRISTPEKYVGIFNRSQDSVTLSVSASSKACNVLCIEITRTVPKLRCSIAHLQNISGASAGRTVYMRSGTMQYMPHASPTSSTQLADLVTEAMSRQQETVAADIAIEYITCDGSAPPASVTLAAPDQYITTSELAERINALTAPNVVCRVHTNGLAFSSASDTLGFKVTFSSADHAKSLGYLQSTVSGGFGLDIVPDNPVFTFGASAGTQKPDDCLPNKVVFEIESHTSTLRVTQRSVQLESKTVGILSDGTHRLAAPLSFVRPGDLSKINGAPCVIVDAAGTHFDFVPLGHSAMTPGSYDVETVIAHPLVLHMQERQTHPYPHIGTLTPLCLVHDLAVDGIGLCPRSLLGMPSGMLTGLFIAGSYSISTADEREFLLRLEGFEGNMIVGNSYKYLAIIPAKRTPASHYVDKHMFFTLPGTQMATAGSMRIAIFREDGTAYNARGKPMRIVAKLS